MKTIDENHDQIHHAHALTVVPKLRNRHSEKVSKVAELYF